MKKAFVKIYQEHRVIQQDSVVQIVKYHAAPSWYH